MPKCVRWMSARVISSPGSQLAGATAAFPQTEKSTVASARCYAKLLTWLVHTWRECARARTY
eukprot:707248-Pyramimonas_sp.AAC.1